MSHPSANLEKELGIPLEATLNVDELSRPAQLLLIPPQDAPSVITIASPSTPIPDDEKLPGSLSTHVSSASSMRGDAARCIVVGRQASSADIRIDHKSVSRRHTAVYYKNRRSAVVLIVRDLGGKHGTYVDDSRLDSNGAVELPVGGHKEHTIRFGNAPLICRVILSSHSASPNDEGGQKINAVDQNGSERMQQDRPSANGDALKQASGTSGNAGVDTEPSTRESREAQIAAMVASFDSNPVYKKYVPEEDENYDVAKSMNSLSTTKSEGNAVNNPQHSGSTKINKYNLPITSSITLSPGSDSFTSSDGTNVPLQANASVSIICFEPSGARLVAGHRDGTLRFYDFHGMRAPASSSSSGEVTYPPFRIVDSDNDWLDSTGRHVLTALAPSSGGGQWIVGSTSAQPKVLDREGGTTLFNFIKGDTYVTDSSKTKGHTAGVTGVAFHPLERDVCWTCGLDGSIRQWDISGRAKTEFNKLVCKQVIAKCKNEKGMRTQVVSNLSVHPNGRKLVVGTACGSIQLWNCFGSGVSSRPLGAIYSAHGGTKPVTFVTFNRSGGRIASRSESDDTVRIWDVSRIEKETGSFGRKFKSRGKEGGVHPPSLLLAVCNGLPAFNESSNCAFGPDGKMICAGTAIDPRVNSSSEAGRIKFYELPAEEKRSKVSDAGGKSSKNKSTIALDPVEEVSLASKSSVLGVQWHPTLNQIAVGTDKGIIQVLYDSSLSTKGALLPASRAVRQSDGLSDLLRSRAPTGSAAFLSSANSKIIVPNALPLFQEAPRATRKTREIERKDAEKTKLPEPPVGGGIKTGAGGLGGGLTFSQYIKDVDKISNNIAGKDPREELFKYNEGKNYVARAYEGDIQKILAEKTVEEEEADLKAGKRQRTK